VKLDHKRVHLVEKFGDLASKINENNDGTPIRIEKVPTLDKLRTNQQK
jgi:hypothetical protein